MIAIIGGAGRIGRRYQAILKYCKFKYEIFDTALDGQNLQDVLDRASHCIIATPTATHLDVLSQVPERIPVLVEKPIATHSDFDADRENTFTVCNYKFVAEAIKAPSDARIYYNYFNTGPDGLAWDCCQLIYLDNKAELKTDSPIWTLTIDGQRIQYTMLELSYIWMIQAFMHNSLGKLWTLRDGLEMSKKVLEYEADHRNPTA